MRKFERTAAAGVSAATTTSGVRALAASVRPVIAFVSPGPWCTVATPSAPLTRACASAMQTAPFSWRAATKRAPWPCRLVVTVKLPLPTTPKTRSTPASVRQRATTSTTRMAWRRYRT